MAPLLTFRSLCSLCVLLGLVSLSLSASAQDQGQGIIQMQENQMGNDERAKAHFRVGQSLYSAGRFNEAAEEWEKAFELSQRSELLYNVYVAYRDAANSTDKAIGALRRYLELGQIEATQRLQLEARLRALEEAQAQNAQAATEPVAATEAAPSTSTVDDNVVIATTDERGESKLLPIVLMSTGGALLVASVVTGLMANGVESKLEDNCENDLCPPAFDLEGERSKGNTLIALNAITGITGVLAVGAGVALFLMSGSEEPTASAFNLGCGLNGCSGAYRASF